MGGIPAGRRDPQTGQSEGSQRQELQAARQDDGAGQAETKRPTPQEEFGQRSDSQDFIPLSFAQTHGGEEAERELGQLPFTREQMRQAGSMLQERVAQEQR